SPTVSVIIIFLDAERYLNEAIRSVFDQTVSDWELLLVDDGSSDASSTIARCHAAGADTVSGALGTRKPRHERVAEPGYPDGSGALCCFPRCGRCLVTGPAGDP